MVVVESEYELVAVSELSDSDDPDTNDPGSKEAARHKILLGLVALNLCMYTQSLSLTAVVSKV